MAWMRVKAAADYSGVSQRTLRKWLKNGLKHSKLPTNTILIKQQWIDEYLEQFCVDMNMTQKIVDNIMKGITQ